MKKEDLFTRVPSYDNFNFENTLIVKRCFNSGINPASILSVPKKFVLVHVYRENGFRSIVCFSDSYEELFDIMESHPRYGSSRHNFLICYNLHNSSIQYLKDINLINICKNVAEYLAIGEYGMLKKSYFKASSWFEKAKNSAALGADIIDNY